MELAAWVFAGDPVWRKRAWPGRGLSRDDAIEPRSAYEAIRTKWCL